MSTVDAKPRTPGQRPRRIAVIGGGITGLSAAHRCVSKEATAEVVLYESSSRLGGIIHTQHQDDYLLELGPDSFITNKPGGVQLCEETGFTDQLIPTDNTFRRSLVLHKGIPQPVPDGFMLMAPSNIRAIEETPVLSAEGKSRLLQEASIPARLDGEDETLASFVTRRFGKETLDRLVQPLVGGIYTSDPEKLSLRATLPRFLDMETEHGSVIAATLAKESSKGVSRSSGSGARYGLFATAQNGLSSLVQHVEAVLRQTNRVQIQMETPIQQVQQPEVSGDARWAVQKTDGSVDTFDAVIMTLPAYRVGDLLVADEYSALRSSLKEIEYASSAIVLTGHRLSDFEHPMDAFGLVIPAIEKRRVLAVSFTSRKFPRRAPKDHVLLRTFVGGAMQSELLEHSDSKIQQLVTEELQQILGLTTEPQFARVVRYNQAMPQYHIGHLDRIARIERLLEQHLGLFVAGSAYRGVGIPDSIASGRQAADAATDLTVTN